MKIIAQLSCMSLLAALLVACSPPPAWQPGDAPLRVWTHEPDVAALVEGACAEWSMTTLRCELVTGLDDYDVAITTEDRAHMTGPTSAQTTFTPGMDGWHYSTRMRADWRAWHPVDRHAVMVHEIGHLLGFWPDAAHGVDDGGHLPMGVMQADNNAPTVTTADLDALAEIWGVAPWEE